ncbi:MAG: fatty acid desaturase [Chlamydiae bacterium]|nr:fatty acid desaturase [Chlamydiota bacterium]MBI3265616.1 fatty acid desaturase [Chlamydiota bacterium]
MLKESNPGHENHGKELDQWKRTVEEYLKPHVGRALWQVINTLLVYVFVWYLMYLGLKFSGWILPPLMILAAGLLVRIFIIFHDCGHGSFFKNRWANDILGFICGVFLFTPYYHWRWEHALHHSTSGDLDRRGVGDIWTLTVQEYLEATRWKRFAYRMARNPIVLFVLAPFFIFLIKQRFPSPGATQRERQSVWWMNFAMTLMVIALCKIYGWFPYLIIQLGMIAIAGSSGVWLFYVQHQFEDVYWERGENWEYISAALQGSSFYKLPKVLQWFSGNIGFHHVHHLSPRIPNYNLERCHQSDPIFQNVKPVTLLSSLKSLSLRLWDESAKKLISFRHLSKHPKNRN